MDSFLIFRVCFITLLNDASPYSGKCDGCGASGVSIMKLSLGRDFFGRVYDRLSPNADMSPKWYCDACSVEKNLQRDFRDIEQEFRKLDKGDPSTLSQSEQMQRARLRLKEIAALLSGQTLTQRLLTSDEVSTLTRSMETPRASST
jgi:hypothetical protein